jgi:hypothetical protein
MRILSTDVESRFGTSDYPEDNPAVALGFPIGKNKKVLLVCSKMTQQVSKLKSLLAVRAKLYSYKMFDRASEGNEHKKI